jgi:glycerophosphoryl diester phosphodiesterase
MDRSGRFERIGHRGAPRELPENTLPSFERALERGADAIELDVHATADGVVVVHHDVVLGANVQPGDLRRAAIAETTWSRLRAVELTSGIGVPTLDDVLRAVGRRARVYVEIKGRGIEQLVVDSLARAETECAIHSFDHDAVVTVRSLAPSVARGILFDRYPARVRQAMDRAGARDVWPKWSLVDRPLVDAVHAAGGRVIVWTVNDRYEAARLVDIGVDGVCSDDLRHVG